MTDAFSEDISAVRSIKAIPTILDIVCRTTGMRFAAVARVTSDRWIACSVHNDIGFGLKPGSELEIGTTICHEIRQSGHAVIIDHVAEDPAFCAHHTPAMYGVQSYISMPIRLADGIFFGTLCAIDPEPHRLNTPETIGMFEMFTEVIGYYLSAIDRMNSTEANLFDERKTSALREQFIAVLGHDLRNPLAAIDAGMQLLLKTPLNDSATAIVNMAQGSATRMAGLIDNVMDFARGRLGWRPDVGPRCRSAGRADAAARRCGIAVQCAGPGDRVPLRVDGTRQLRSPPNRAARLKPARQRPDLWGGGQTDPDRCDDDGRLVRAFRRQCW